MCTQSLEYVLAERLLMRGTEAGQWFGEVGMQILSSQQEQSQVRLVRHQPGTRLCLLQSSSRMQRDRCAAPSPAGQPREPATDPAGHWYRCGQFPSARVGRRVPVTPHERRVAALGEGSTSHGSVRPRLAVQRGPDGQQIVECRHRRCHVRSHLQSPFELIITILGVG